MNNNLFDNISSKYIINLIFDYIKCKNTKFKIIQYSKSLQNIINIKLFDYQSMYVNKFGFKYKDYIHYHPNEYLNCFNKDILNKKYKEDLDKSNIDNKLFKKIVANVCIKIANETEFIKDEFSSIHRVPEEIIEIYSPLFDEISNSPFFKKFFTILISIDIIQKYDLIKDYISFFKKLNETNINYSSLTINYKENSNSEIIKQLNINFDNIKRFTFNYEEDEKKDYSNSNNYHIFFNNLFSLFNAKNNLVYLNLKRINRNYNKLNSNYIKLINDFKSLTNFMYE